MHVYQLETLYSTWGVLGHIPLKKHQCRVLVVSESAAQSVLVGFFFFLQNLVRGMYEWVDGYKTYGSKKSLGNIWGHRGQKGHFYKLLLHFTYSMVTWLMNLKNLGILYKSYGSRSTWGHIRAQKIGSNYKQLKMAKLIVSSERSNYKHAHMTKITV